MNWREVSQSEFFDVMNPLDVHPHILPGKFPYTSIWKLRNGKIVGKSNDIKGDGRCAYSLPIEEAGK